MNNPTASFKLPSIKIMPKETAEEFIGIATK